MWRADGLGAEGGVRDTVLSGYWDRRKLLWWWLLRRIKHFTCNDWKVYLEVDIALANTGVSICCNRGESVRAGTLHITQSCQVVLKTVNLIVWD